MTIFIIITSQLFFLNGETISCQELWKIIDLFNKYLLALPCACGWKYKEMKTLAFHLSLHRGQGLGDADSPPKNLVEETQWYLH